VSEWKYDSKNRVTDIEHLHAGALTSFFRYQYNSNDNRTAMTDRHGTRQYGYDALDRLTGVTFTPDTFSALSPSLGLRLSQRFCIIRRAGNPDFPARPHSWPLTPTPRLSGAVTKCPHGRPWLEAVRGTSCPARILKPETRS